MTYVRDTDGCIVRDNAGNALTHEVEREYPARYSESDLERAWEVFREREGER